MPLHLLKNIGDDCLLGLWEINENLKDFMNLVELCADENELVNNFKCEDRKTEWLSVRALLKEMVGQPLKIWYTPEKKPYIENSDYNISISHSNKISGILLSKKHRVGLDLEFMSHKIENIAKKFIGDDEYITSDQEKKHLHLYIHWCAKEALYKICDKQDIIFKTNIFIKPFEPKQEGKIFGKVLTKYINEEFELTYFCHNNYIIVYTMK